MIFKKSLSDRIFKIEKQCYADWCNHIFRDGDEYEVENLLFVGDVFVCKECHNKFLESIEETKRLRHEEAEKIKRVDYKILAEEIVKLMPKIED